MKEKLTDAQIEEEIKRLNASDAVRLVRYQERLKYKRRQYLYMLRYMEKRGKAMMAAGITEDILKKQYEEVSVCE